MPPHSPPTCPFHTEIGPISGRPARLFGLVLIAASFVAVVRSLAVVITRGKKKMADLENPPDNVLRKEDSGVGPNTDSASPQSSPTQEANSHLDSLKEEQRLLLHRAPVHPWAAPPSPLPGPYDAPYYPLPLPTLQSQSQDTMEGASQKIATTSYMRWSSPNSELPTATVLEGSTTVSTRGWKRTQWTLSPG